MNTDRKPLFMLADSQPLFCTGGDSILPALQMSLQVSERNVTRAAYIGACNGDAPEYFDLFIAAMDGVNLHDSRMIRAEFGKDDRAFLESADLLMLAGGDIDAGWATMRSTGLDEAIISKYYAGAVLMGVSAGAMQLGLGWYGKEDGRVSEGLKLAPYYIDVRCESDDWRRLRALVETAKEFTKGFGIASGGAVIYHADMAMEAVRQPVAEFGNSAKKNGRMMGNLLLPATPPPHEARDAPTLIDETTS